MSDIRQLRHSQCTDFVVFADICSCIFKLAAIERAVGMDLFIV